MTFNKNKHVNIALLGLPSAFAVGHTQIATGFTPSTAITSNELGILHQPSAVRYAQQPASSVGSTATATTRLLL